MPKPIDNPQHISLLIPTRARPAYLQNLFDSLEATTQDKGLVDVWLYVDEDDAITREYIASGQHASYGFRINWMIGERSRTAGQMNNTLWQKCTSNAGIYMPFTDDLLLATPAWDQNIRAAFNCHPDRILLAYPDEATASGDQVTIAILSAQWINITGRIYTPYFPYWFDDSWVDQVAQMVGRKVKVSVQTNPQGGRGKTTRMRNLRFWGRYFHNLLDERIAEAEQLRRAIYPRDCPEYRANVEAGKRLAQHFRTQGQERDNARTIYTERMLSGPSAKLKPSEAYLAIEVGAVNHLFSKARALFVQQRYADALAMLDNIHYAALKFENLSSARTLCLEAMKRQTEWPEDLRLVPAGENPDALDPRLDPLSELRIRLMPVTLRVGLIGDLIINHPINQWPSVLGKFLAQYRRRHQG
jgi:hypothetical protein